MIDYLLHHQVLPDTLIRTGIRRLLRRRLDQETARYHEADYVKDLRTRPLAEHASDANQQHYELPVRFFRECLGPRLKYSSAWFPKGNETLGEAEEAMLNLYVERAGLEDGQDILELGCGWGSLTLYLAQRFPRARIVGLSNSHSQKSYIDAQARQHRLGNVHVVTCDINHVGFGPQSFDRVVSVEMFEHLKNYARLFENVARWLRPDGRVFVHIFTHARVAYHFVPEQADDWMARYFFTGGQMPSHALLTRFQEHLLLEQDWAVSGIHYQRTAELWLRNMDQARETLWPVFVETYGTEARRWWSYWRIFFMSCAELWGYNHGREWQVSHYLFRRR
jgi:cyclopropane-fatty-acyl-phospholipid synthase